MLEGLWEDAWAAIGGTSGSVSGEIDGQSYTITWGGYDRRLWIVAILALVLGAWLSGRVRLVR